MVKLWVFISVIKKLAQHTNNFLLAQPSIQPIFVIVYFFLQKSGKLAFIKSTNEGCKNKSGAMSPNFRALQIYLLTNVRRLKLFMASGHVL